MAPDDNDSDKSKDEKPSLSDQRVYKVYIGFWSVMAVYVIIAISALCLFATYAFIIARYDDGDQWVKFGQIGDSFGVFNGLAFIAIIISLYFQREDLKTQRDELKLTREEVASQTDIFNVEMSDRIFFRAYDQWLHRRSSCQKTITNYRSTLYKYIQETLSSDVYELPTSPDGVAAIHSAIRQLIEEQYFRITNFFQDANFSSYCNYAVLLMDIITSPNAQPARSKVYLEFLTSNFHLDEYLLFSVSKLITDEFVESSPKELLEDFGDEEAICINNDFVDPFLIKICISTSGLRITIEPFTGPDLEAHDLQDLDDHYSE